MLSLIYSSFSSEGELQMLKLLFLLKNTSTEHLQMELKRVESYCLILIIGGNGDTFYFPLHNCLISLRKISAHFFLEIALQLHNCSLIYRENLVGLKPLSLVI